MKTPALAVFLVVLLIVNSSQAFKFPFMSDATDVILSSEGYDYIVVGGGAAGCPLAATLSEKFKVLLLERGGSPYENPFIMNEINFPLALFSPAISQLFNSTDGIENTRARVLGGGTSINAGFYDRASFQEQKQLNLDLQRAHASYKYIENALITIPQLGPFQTAFHASLVEAGVLPDNGRTLDHFIGTKSGGTIFNNSIRHPSSDLLAFGNPNNIQVVINAPVHRILFNGDASKAVGVEFTDSNGVVSQALLSNNAASEVIVSSSAIGSPHLLMLSGIGPKKHLQHFGIQVLHDLPVGKRIADNPNTPIIFTSPVDVEVSLVRVAGITYFGSYIESISGVLGSRNNTIYQKIHGPRSEGDVELITRNIQDNLRITFNYLKDPVDMNICARGVAMVEKVFKAKSLSRFITKPFVVPTTSGTARYEDYEDFCRKNIQTMWHYHGSCRVGAVVDPKYRVLGVPNLRVIDASVLDFCPGTNPQASIMMLGRYMGVEITEDRS